MSYLNNADITDNVIAGFANDSRWSTWMSRVDSELIKVGKELGVDSDDFYAMLHPIVVEYLLACLGEKICCDTIGTVSTESPLDEKYRIKYEYYRSRRAELQKSITADMLTETEQDLDADDFSGQGCIINLG